jgi:predicted SnoaL-like aldol condensation-catalyzing enzyme
MHFSKLIALPAVFAAAASAQYCPGKAATPEEQAKIFHEFAEQLYLKKEVAPAFKTFVSPDLVEHSANATSLQGTIGMLSFIFKDVKMTRLNEAVSNGVGFIHLKAEGGPLPVPNALVDIYKFGPNSTCLVEHWDLMLPKPANAPNPKAFW